MSPGRTAPRHLRPRSEEWPLNLEILTGTPGGSDLVRDYLAGPSGPASAYFTGWYGDADAYRARAEAVDAAFDRDARDAVASLVQPAGPVGKARLDDWGADGGYLVTTGQQPGLFAGPLYNLYKALTAVRLAEVLEEVVERPVLPLFWIASDDHDWAEANHTWVVDLENDLRRIALPDRPGLPTEALHRIELGPGAEEALEELLAALPETDFSEPFREALRRCWSAEGTLPAGFRCTLQSLMADTPLVFLDAAHPGLKERSRPILERELREAAAREAELGRRAGELESAGFHVQVPILEGGVNLFLEGRGGRERLYREGDGFRLRQSGEALGTEVVLERFRDDPRSLSPNVLLRPVVEAAVLPTLGYVAGPGELAYYAQLGPLYEAHDVHPPVVHPRASATLVESKIRKVLDKFGLEPEALATPFHELAAEIARDEVPDDVRSALGELRGAIVRGAQQLTEETRDIDPTLRGPVTHARNTAFQALDELEKKIVQSVKRENEIALAQLEKARLHLFPEGKPQERILNPFYYLVRYGRELVPALLEAFRSEPGVAPFRSTASAAAPAEGDG